MSASDYAAKLRELANQHDELGSLEDALDATAEAYRADKTEENLEAYNAAAEALREARLGIRSSDVMVSSNEPGSVTIGGAGVGKASVSADKPAPMTEADEPIEEV